MARSQLLGRPRKLRDGQNWRHSGFQMSDPRRATEPSTTSEQPAADKETASGHSRHRRRWVIASLSLAAAGILAIAATAWIGSRANIIKTQLEATSQLLPVLKEDIADDKPKEARAAAAQLRAHTAAARDA